MAQRMRDEDIGDAAQAKDPRSVLGDINAAHSNN